MLFYSNGEYVVDENTLLDEMWDSVGEDYESKDELLETIRDSHEFAGYYQIEVSESISNFFDSDEKEEEEYDEFSDRSKWPIAIDDYGSILDANDDYDDLDNYIDDAAIIYIKDENERRYINRYTHVYASSPGLWVHCSLNGSDIEWYSWDGLVEDFNVLA